MNHTGYMKKAIELAEKGLSTVSPNPAVGALIVKNNKIIGEGYHKGSGHSHAEIVAIENAAESVEGATLYCTLEPCSNDYKGKKQPPCTDRIIKEKISLVVISLIDPNPHVNGKGIARLEAAGIKVISGILKERTQILNEVFIKNITNRLPYIHLKIAQTVDGRIAAPDGSSKWITDKEAREDVHKIRSLYDAILIGSKTASADNPSLTVRNGSGSNPLRIVLDSKLSIDPGSKLLTDNDSTNTLIVTGDYPSKSDISLIQNNHISIIRIPLNNNGYINLQKLLKHLWKMGICSILIEGGSEIYTSFIREKLFDKLTIYIAPIICGNGINSINNIGSERMSDSLQLKRVSYKTINNQIVMTGYRN